MSSWFNQNNRERLSLSSFRLKYGDILFCYFLQLPWIPWTVRENEANTRKQAKTYSFAERTGTLIIAYFMGFNVK